MAFIRETSYKVSKSSSKISTSQKHGLFSINPLSSSSSSCPTTTSSSSLLIHHSHPSSLSKIVSEMKSPSSSSSPSTCKRSASSTSLLTWWSTCLLLSVAIILASSSGTLANPKHAWERPGCHKVGHTRKVTIPECVEFTITTNACRGYCESFAVPSAWYRLQNNPSQAITSVGQCCNIMETEDVTVNVMCMEGQKELVFKSAKSCACYHCKKD